MNSKNKNVKSDPNLDKRFYIIVIALCVIPLPFLFFVSQLYIPVFTVSWLVWMVSGLLLSTKISNIIWKDK